MQNNTNNSHSYPLQQSNPQISKPKCSPNRILEVKWSYRWEIYRRLKALDIECKCATNEPLQIYLYSPTTLIQIWSVLRQHRVSREESIALLENCWKL